MSNLKERLNKEQARNNSIGKTVNVLKPKKFSLDEPPRSERPTAKIERTTGGGCSFNSVDCPKCEKLIILDGMDLRIMSTICKKCHCVFNLEK